MVINMKPKKPSKIAYKKILVNNYQVIELTNYLTV